MQNLGTFKRYEPESPEIPGATYVKNEDGTDDEINIVCITDDGNALFPVDMTVWEILEDEAPEGILTDGYNARIIDCVYALDQTIIARGTQFRLLKEAEDTIRYLERAVKRGMVTEDETGRLEVWMSIVCWWAGDSLGKRGRQSRLKKTAALKCF